MSTGVPARVATCPALIWLLVTVPGTTCNFSSCTNTSLFSGSNSWFNTPGGSAAKASSVGAKTVYGPSPAKVSSKPAAWIALTSVWNFSLSVALSTKVPLVGAASVEASGFSPSWRVGTGWVGTLSSTDWGVLSNESWGGCFWANAGRLRQILNPKTLNSNWVRVFIWLISPECYVWSILMSQSLQDFKSHCSGNQYPGVEDEVLA